MRRRSPPAATALKNPVPLIAPTCACPDTTAWTIAGSPLIWMRVTSRFCFSQNPPSFAILYATVRGEVPLTAKFSLTTGPRVGDPAAAVGAVVAGAAEDAAGGSAPGPTDSPTT